MSNDCIVDYYIIKLEKCNISTKFLQILCRKGMQGFF